MGQPDSRVTRLRSVTSTQDVARGLPVGSIVLADHQTAGRGRLERRWEAPEGSGLLVSFVLDPSPLLSLAAGVAAAEACGPNVRLKWPNDLLLEGRKLGGILVEVHQGKAVCGIGINLSWAPPDGARLGAARDEVFALLRDRLASWATAPPEEILGRWRQLSDTIGRRVRIELPNETREGVAEDIGPGGELILDGVSYVSGTLRHLT